MLERDTDAREDGRSASTNGFPLENYFLKALCSLSPEERQVIRKYYGLRGETPMTLEDIANLLGLTRDYVGNIKQRAIETLKCFAKDG
jgi:DNA-directed RNA polymerase sigma subunit (sigma70/sigma32)